MTDRQKRALQRIPGKYRAPAANAYGNKPSKAIAVKAKCLDCCNWIAKEITLCTAETCPLWPVRPYQKKGKM